ncbi:hypothetical protein [Flavobacterium sp.]|uniref:hypothetical protein n=1 Tax=Flavobacterium sp. TaxID=239 RepID=UPI00374DEA13
MYIFNLQKLKEYKEHILHSQELLNISDIFSPIEKVRINVCYNILSEIVTDKIKQMEVATKNATNLTVSDYNQL